MIMKPKHLKPEMALAVLNNLKTRTSMPVNPQSLIPDDWAEWGIEAKAAFIRHYAKYKIGDVLYIRERARLMGWDGHSLRQIFQYEADGSFAKSLIVPKRIKPIRTGNCVPNGCFRELARIFVKITGVRVEWSEDMSLDDIIAEGIQYDNDQGRGHLREKFNALWNSCYPELMGDPHWRFAYTFERTDKP
jgi:hypothetical protein